MNEAAAAAEQDNQNNEIAFLWNITMSIFCVLTAAIAAGLTLGMLSIDPLFLAVKMGRGSSSSSSLSCADVLATSSTDHTNNLNNSNTGSYQNNHYEQQSNRNENITEKEKEALEEEYAKTIYPLVKQHHRLLVTLLLLNSIANESLPLFLDELVPSYVAVLLSVTMVLVFGEILPSAFFTGPEQLRTAAFMAPFVRRK